LEDAGFIAAMDAGKKHTVTVFLMKFLEFRNAGSLKTGCADE
jgi:hypothetical protein